MKSVVDFLFVDKPSGIATHAVAGGKYAATGFDELLDQFLGSASYICHRLDKGTTGAMVFTTNAEATTRLTKLFASRAVKKRYLFLSAGKAASDFARIESHIEKRGDKFVSHNDSEINAKTELKLIKREGKFSLWEARPETGKPHQIRLHAEALGAPVLGDIEHNGAPFPSLCLHSNDLQFEDAGVAFSHASPPPIYFERLDLLSHPRVCGWLAAIDRRQRWLRSKAAVIALPAMNSLKADHLLDLDTFRLIHSEGGMLRMDRLGDVFDLQWFSSQPPSERDWNEIKILLDVIDAKQWRVHLRQNRGAQPNAQLVWESSPDLEKRWNVRENGISFGMREDSGLSAGLFLDQRANRRWVREESNEKSVLNLFCYTGGFSVAAAVGGAKHIVSVDVSKNFLEWTKLNFAQNGFAPEKFEFRAMDARDYLKYAAKKSFTFDLIVCDPPSFGRSDKGVFRLEKDLPQLLTALANVLSENGKILFSANYEGWKDQLEFDTAIRDVIKAQKLDLKLKESDRAHFPLPIPDLDFELPDQPRVMKCALLSRR